MTHNAALKKETFSGQVVDWTAGWLTKQGFTRQGIDGARADDLNENGKCFGPGAKDGKIDASEAFAVATGSGTFNKFVAALQSSRINPFTKLDAGFDLSWLKLNEPGKPFYQVDTAKADAWKAALLGDAAKPGVLLSRWNLGPSKFVGLYDELNKTWSWESTEAVAQFARWSLQGTELGLLPLKDQLEIADKFADQVSFPTQTDDQQKILKDLIRKELRAAVVASNRGFTANQKISLYTQLRAGGLEAQGKKAKELYELALGIDPQNEAARKHLGLALIASDKTRSDGVAMLNLTYERGLRDPDLLAGLASAEASSGNYREAFRFAEEWARAGFATVEEKKIFLPQVVAWSQETFDPLAADSIYRKAGDGLSDADRKPIDDALYGDLSVWIKAAEHQKDRLGNFILARKILDREEGLDLAARNRIQFDPANEERVKVKTEKIRKRLDDNEIYAEVHLHQWLDKSETELLIADAGEKKAILNQIGRAEKTVAALEELDGLASPAIDASAMLAPFRRKLRSGPVTSDRALEFLATFEKSLLVSNPAPKRAVRMMIQDAREGIAGGKPLGFVFADLDKGLSGVLNAPKIRHTDVSQLIRDAKSKIANGYFYGNQSLYDEGLQDLDGLRRYAAAETAKDQAFKWLLSLYPANTHSVFKKPGDLSGTTEAMKWITLSANYEAKPETVAKLPINVRLAELRIQDPARAAGYDRILIDCERTAVWQGQTGADYRFQVPTFDDPDVSKPIGVVGFREGTPASMKDLNARTEKLVATYLDPKVSVTDLLGETEKTRATAALKDNPAYQDRLDLETNLQTLPEYVLFLKSFSTFQARNLEGLTTEILQGGRDFLVARGEVYVRQLQREQELLDKEWKNCPPGDETTGGYTDQQIAIQVSREIAAQDLKEVQDSLSVLKAMDPSDVSAMGANLAVLNEKSLRFFPIEQSLSQRLLEREEKDISGMYADPKNPKSVMPDRTVLESAFGDRNDVAKLSIADMEKTVQNLRKYGAALDDVAFSRSLDSKIKMIASQEKEYGTWKDVENLWLKEVDVRDFAGFKQKYETLRDRWLAGDASVRREFIALESAQINDVLKSKVDSVTYTKFAAGVGIVIASAFTAGLVAELAAPFLVTALGAEGAATAGVFVNGLAFTTSHRFFTSAVTRDWTSFSNIWNRPLDFAEEVVFNTAMFAFLGKAMKTYDGLFAARLGRGGALFKAGEFVWEGGAFQIFNFFQQNTSAILHNRFDASKMFAAFTPEAFIHGFVFLFALKAGGALSMPLTRASTEAAKAWMGKIAPTYVERQMQAEVEGSLKALEDFASKGKGTFEEVMARYESALLRQKKFLEDLPEGIRNEQTQALNGQALRELQEYRQAYQKSVFRSVGVENNKNPFGLHQVTNDGVLTYAADKGVDLVRALKEDPRVKWFKISANGLVTVRVTDPLGRDATVRLDATLRPDQLQKMQEAAKISGTENVSEEQQSGGQAVPNVGAPAAVF